MMMPLKDRTKVEQVLVRISTGQFDGNDIDNLVIKLRAYAGSRKIFREMGDFVAHADRRDRGIAFEAMNRVADRMRFLMEFDGENPPLDIAVVPPYVYRLFISQTKRANERYLKDNFKLGISSLLNRIEASYVFDKREKCYRLRPGKGLNIVEPLRYALSFVDMNPSFHIAEFHADLAALLKQEKIKYDEKALQEQQDRITLTILCTLAGSKISLSEDDAKCILGSDHSTRILSGRWRQPNGEVTEDPKSFGNLRLDGQVPIRVRKGVVQMVFPLISTDLKVQEHCAEEMFSRQAVDGEFGRVEAEHVTFSESMQTNDDFKLAKIPEEELAAS